MKYLLPLLIAFILLMGTWQMVRADQPSNNSTIDLWADERVQQIERQIRDLQRQQYKQRQDEQYRQHKEYWDAQQQDAERQWEYRRDHRRAN